MSQCFLKQQTVPKGTTATAQRVLTQLAEASGDDGGAARKMETKPADVHLLAFWT